MGLAQTGTEMIEEAKRSLEPTGSLTSRWQAGDRSGRKAPHHLTLLLFQFCAAATGASQRLSGWMGQRGQGEGPFPRAWKTLGKSVALSP